MAPTLTQANRPFRATTPLDSPDALVPVRMKGEEHVSRPFVYTVDFASTDGRIDPKKLMGKPVTLHIDVPEEPGTSRHINGVVRSFSNLGMDHYFYRYRAEIVPKLWFLTLSSDCRIFEKEKLDDILTRMLQKAGVTFKFKLAAALPVIPYLTQYRETDFAFFSRMLEEWGLYYYFEHTNGSHTLVITDAHAGTIAANEVAQAEVTNQMFSEQHKAGTVYRIGREYAMHTAKVGLANHYLLKSDVSASQTSSLVGALSGSEMHDFVGDLEPSLLPAGDAKVRIEGAEHVGDVISGTSNYVMFRAGTRVKLPSGPFTGDVHLLSVTHTLETGDLHASGELTWQYENQFRSIPASVRYHPPRVTPKPSVRGTHSAKVTGKGGIDVDADGRILLIFPWDREQASTGHRVHVASVWAGTGWGFIQIPRVGQEVLVEYLEGDIDRPIVTGRVYNKDNKHPYALPANKTQTGWKSRTLDGGDDNFNEIRFEDKKGEEHVYVQAEKDLKTHVKNDEVREVLHDRTTTIKNHDTRTVEEGNDTHTVKKGDQTIKVSTGKQTITVKADQSTTIESGNRSVTIQQGNDTLGVKMGNISIKADAGSITVQAMQKIELKVGGNSIVIDMTGVTIKGTMVKIEGQAMAEMKSPMTKVEGSGMMEVKGAMTQVKGDGILIAKGGITMIN